ncbi:ERMES complex subunit MMM1 Ecym_8282 [Eremothecium cymbalariae DBVPG|uniref:Maintenance of mitochondrial morphology protein 1 n=1 Tax=Eremothecium cymbalariae (strain CBS 270.75 / DBVPG 7215 / KCTC 17166 / NRRL Y-17582) TaxID=931890 RepID=G8JXJ0_ERECY|nr:Hypothetical protein Ecym_8282 [Eremothecium cymbalariae DBVPG\
MTSDVLGVSSAIESLLKVNDSWVSDEQHDNGSSVGIGTGGNNGSIIDNADEQLISLDDFIREALPQHLHKLFLDSFYNIGQNGVLISPTTSSGAQNPHFTLPMLPSNAPLLPPSSSYTFSSWSFVQGLVAGQLSVIMVLIFFIKFFIFSDGPSKRSGETPQNSGSNINPGIAGPQLLSLTTSRFLSTIIKRGGKDGSDFIDDKENECSRQINTILEKTYYTVETHSPESLDWFNVLIAQMIDQFREEALRKDNIIHSLNDYISRKSDELPQYLDSIKITELDIGDDFPIFSNCRIQYSPNLNKKRLEAKIDIDLSDRLALGIETRLLMNYPKPLTASLPVQLTVSMVRFQACLTVSLTTAEEFVPTVTDSSDRDEESEEDGHYLVFSFSPDYRMEFDIKSLIGSRSKLENIPKISSLLQDQINKWFMDRCVEPRFQFVKLPSLWPRSKNTREEKTELQDDDPVKNSE